MRGLFISFEGGEGSGKSSQIRRLAGRLEGLDLEVIVAREPGGTPAGDMIRDILLDPVHVGLDPLAELFLYEASRAHHVSAVIRPALEAGTVVLTDRFADSSYAYQGYGRALDLDMVRAMNSAATGGLTPDLTFFLDVDPAEGVAAATPGGADRLELEHLDFHERVRLGFRELAESEPERVKLIPRDTPDTVAAAIWVHVETLLCERGMLR
ncbi:MAG: dTMP kinase [Coriobacteriia bacterium]|nr:dTMP kinase [Coriobacteriia bacterium]